MEFICILDAKYPNNVCSKSGTLVNENIVTHS
jgi:hypothetical protein